MGHAARRTFALSTIVVFKEIAKDGLILIWDAEVQVHKLESPVGSKKTVKQSKYEDLPITDAAKSVLWSKET